MSRLDENLELIKSILLDISRSLAVIADALRKDEVTP